MKKGPTALGADLEKREKRKAGATFNVIKKRADTAECSMIPCGKGGGGDRL